MSGSSSKVNYFEKSEFLNSCRKTLVSTLRTGDVQDHTLLKSIISNIFSDDLAIIKDHYAGLMIYMHYFSKKLAFNDLSSLLEDQLRKDNTDEMNKPFSVVLIYGALIKSECIFSWSSDDQNKIICKLLHIAKKNPSLHYIIFDYLNYLTSTNKTDSFLAEQILSRKHNFSKNSTCFHLHFFLKVEKKCGNSHGESDIVKNMDPDVLSKLFLSECEHFSHINELTSLMSPIFLSDVNLALTYWESLISKYEEDKVPYKAERILVLLSSIMNDLSSDSVVVMDKLLSPSLFSLIYHSKKSELVNSILLAFTKALKLSSDETKLVLFHSILTSTKFSTKSNLHGFMEQIISSLNADGVNTVSKIFVKIIKGVMEKNLDSGPIKYTANERVYFVTSYGKLLNHGVCRQDIKIRKKGIQNLFSFGFLSENSEIVPSEVAAAARKVFYTSLLQRYSKLVDYINVLDSIVSTVTNKLSDSQNFVVPISSQVRKHWDNGLKLLKSIEDDIITDNLIVFQVVTLYMMLYLLKSEKVASDTIKEVSNVLKHARSKDEHNDIHWTEVMVDVFLHLLSMPNESHRQFICCVFSHICNSMTPKALELILSAVKPSEDGDLTDAETESEDSGEESDESGEEDPSSGVSSESEMEETPNEKLKMALRDELFKLDTASTCGSVDLDDLDEEEGKKLNLSLGRVFKDQVKQKSKFDTFTVSFKIRAIDLLSIFADQDQSVETNLKIISHIIKYLKLSIPIKDLQVYTASLKKCFKAVVGSIKVTNVSKVKSDFLCDVFDQIIANDCPKSIYLEISPEIAESCLLIVKLSEAKGNFKEIVNKLKGVFDSFFSKLDTYYSPNLISSIILSLSPAAPYLLPTIVDYAFSNEIKTQKKYQAMELLCNFFSSKRFCVVNSPKLSSKIGKVEEKIIQNSFFFLQSFKESKKELSSKYCATLFQLLIPILRNFISCEKKIEEFVNLEEILKSSYDDIFACLDGKKEKQHFKHLCRLFSINCASGMSKRKLKKLQNMKGSSDDLNGKSGKKNLESSAKKKKSINGRSDLNEGENDLNENGGQPELASTKKRKSNILDGSTLRGGSGLKSSPKKSVSSMENDGGVNGSDAGQELSAKKKKKRKSNVEVMKIDLEEDGASSPSKNKDFMANLEDESKPNENRETNHELSVKKKRKSGNQGNGDIQSSPEENLNIVIYYESSPKKKKKSLS